MAIFTPAGAVLGLGANAAYQMTELNGAGNIKKYAAKFRERYGPTQADAMEKYSFGKIIDAADVIVGAASQTSTYLSSVSNLRPAVKNKWVKALVQNYFGEELPMAFSVSTTSKAGGDIQVGIVTNADDEKLLSICVLCYIGEPPPAGGAATPAPKTHRGAV